jgi:hypothetical protein
MQTNLLLPIEVMQACLDISLIDPSTILSVPRSKKKNLSVATMRGCDFAGVNCYWLLV